MNRQQERAGLFTAISALFTATVIEMARLLPSARPALVPIVETVAENAAIRNVGVVEKGVVGLIPALEKTGPAIPFGTVKNSLGEVGNFYRIMGQKSLVGGLETTASRMAGKYPAIELAEIESRLALANDSLLPKSIGSPLTGPAWPRVSSTCLIGRRAWIGVESKALNLLEDGLSSEMGSVIEGETVSWEFITTTAPARPIAELAARRLATSNHRILAIVPDEEAFAPVFGHEPSAFEVRQMESMGRSFEGLARTEVASSKDFGRQQLFDWLRAQPADSQAIVVGHSLESDAVRELRLPSGESVSLDEIHRVALEGNATSAVLTCFGPDFGLSRQIRMKDAYGMCHKGTEAILQNGGLTASELNLVMCRERARQDFTRVTISVATPTIGGGSALVVNSYYSSATTTGLRTIDRISSTASRK